MNWLLLSEIWFQVCRRLGHEITHHALATAMHRIDGGAEEWDVYLKRAQIECQRQWDLEDAGVRAKMERHQRCHHVAMQPVAAGWEIRVQDGYVWTYASIREWLRDYPVYEAWFYQADRPVQRRAEVNHVQ